MRAGPPRADTSLISKQLEHSLGFDFVKTLSSSLGAADSDLVSTILDTAARFAHDNLIQLNFEMDQVGAQLVEDRIRTAPGHIEAWKQFIADGWTSLDQSEAYGGQGLPLALGLAVQELVDRTCPAFGMLVILQRAAARLIAKWADTETCSKWLPGIIDGDVSATICISEPGAGSDVAQMRTLASRDVDGNWRISGDKCWISYGDHDLTNRIVHCVLARTGTGADGKPEIGLFLVEGATAQREAVKVLRAEKKLGLHGSPTCVLAFDNASATLLGNPARGLAQMFVMITQMRLAVGAMGLGIASSVTDVAIAYALERRQGGKPGQPVAIANHIDVQRQLTEMIARTEILRGLLYTCANYADIAQHGTDEAQRTAAEELLRFLLPIVKTLGANASFLNASTAVQVLGGAGYTSDWPVEQALRDSRILAIFEGTTGIQALDMVHRRVKLDSGGLSLFFTEARALNDPDLNRCLDNLDQAARWIIDDGVQRSDVEAGAVAFLDLATLAAEGWIAARFRKMGDLSHFRMRIAARYCLSDIADRSAALARLVSAGASRIATKDELENIMPN